MEELICRGTPAQVARRVLAVLAEDPDLLWITDAGGEAWTLAKIVNLDFWGRLKPDILESQELVEVMVLRGNWPVIGYITVEHLSGYVLVTAHNRWHSTEADDAHNIRRRLSEDFTALAPIWERVKAELIRLGLVIEAEPAQVKRDEDAPKKRGPIGRRRDPDNEWANQQVNEIGRTPAEVYPEWAERRRNHGTLKQLDNSLDSFKHAIALKKK